MFDFIGLIMLFALFFISLRLFFTFEVIRSPCAEMLATIGSGPSLPSIMTMCFGASILLGLFWVAIALNASVTRQLSAMRVTWYLIIGVAIFFLALFNRALVSQKYVKPPDGSLLVAIDNGHVEEPRWADYEDGVWYAYGISACVWLDENKLAIGTDWRNRREYPLIDRLGLGRPYIDMLIENQTYRAMTDYERERFIKKQDCQSDLTLYGQPISVCEHDYLYPVQSGLKPPRYEIEVLAPELLIMEAEKYAD